MNDTLTTRALDREASARRERLASTLDELSASLTPGRVLDEVLSYAKGGGGNFLMGLGKSAAANPLPTLLISTGCALFLSGKGGIHLAGARKQSSGRESQTEYSRSIRGRHEESEGIFSKTAGAVSGAASTVADKVGSAAGSVASAAADVGTRIVDSAKGAASTIADTTTKAGEGVAFAGARARQYAGDVAGTAQFSAASAQRKATLLGRELQGKAADAFNEYPLVVAAGGLLLGAALAAFLPRTRIEDRYLGETSETMKGALADGVFEGVNRVATGVENVVSKVSQTAGEEDVFGAAKDSIDALSDKVGKTFKAGKNAINEEFGSDKKH